MNPIITYQKSNYIFFISPLINCFICLKSLLSLFCSLLWNLSWTSVLSTLITVYYPLNYFNSFFLSNSLDFERAISRGLKVHSLALLSASCCLIEVECLTRASSLDMN